MLRKVGASYVVGPTSSITNGTPELTTPSITTLRFAVSPGEPVAIMNVIKVARPFGLHSSLAIQYLMVFAYNEGTGLNVKDTFGFVDSTLSTTLPAIGCFCTNVSGLTTEVNYFCV